MTQIPEEIENKNSLENSILITPMKHKLDIKPMNFINNQTRQEVSTQKVSKRTSESKKHHQLNLSTREDQQQQQIEPANINIEEFYENIREDINHIKESASHTQPTNGDDLQSKLEMIRRNKAMLEAKMREYDKKKVNMQQITSGNAATSSAF